MSSRIKSLEELNKAYETETKKKSQRVETTKSKTKSKIEDRPKVKAKNKIEDRPKVKTENKIEDRPKVKTESKIEDRPKIKTESKTKSRTKNRSAIKFRSKSQRESQTWISKGIIAIGGILVIIVICLFVGIRGSVRNQIRNSKKIVPSILNSDEQEKWENMEVQTGKFYIELNTRIEVDDQNAYIRLINPNYSAYTFSIQIWEKGDENNLLYASEKLMPGTILETAGLARPLTSDECEAVVNYVIYDETGEEKSSYPIDVKLIKKV